MCRVTSTVSVYCSGLAYDSRNRSMRFDCPNLAKHPANPTGRKGAGPFWCDDCEAKRRAHIDKFFEENVRV